MEGEPNGATQRVLISFVLSFLQERLDDGCTPSTLKVYVAAISAFHNGFDRQSIGKSDLVIKFLRGARLLNSK